MVPSSKRIAHYLARLDPTLTDPTRLAVITLQTQNFAAYVREFYPYQVACSEILDAAGVPSTSRILYQAFNSILYRIAESSSGPAFANEAGSAATLFAARGLDIAILMSIIVNVWASSGLGFYAEPHLVVAVITNKVGLAPIHLQGEITNPSSNVEDVILTMNVEHYVTDAWVEVFTDTQTLSGVAPHTSSTPTSSVTQWTPAGASTRFRTGVSCHAVGQTLPTALTLYGAEFNVTLT